MVSYPPKPLLPSDIIEDERAEPVFTWLLPEYSPCLNVHSSVSLLLKLSWLDAFKLLACVQGSPRVELWGKLATPLMFGNPVDWPLILVFWNSPLYESSVSFVIFHLAAGAIRKFLDDSKSMKLLPLLPAKLRRTATSPKTWFKSIVDLKKS